jgi:TRAP-type mannitol/chloroaromatic compound transport system permease large subunit
MDIGLITILMFASLLILLLTGLPLVFCLGTVSLGFTYFLWGPPAIMQVASACFGGSLNIILVACPLFIFMANVLQFSGLADDLYDMIYTWSGKMNGGLAMGTVAICAVFRRHVRHQRGCYGEHGRNRDTFYAEPELQQVSWPWARWPRAAPWAF